MPALNGSVIAYIGEDERYRAVVLDAVAAAKMGNAPLILYDADAASRFGSPLPTWWSSDGEGEEDRNLLRPEHLEAAGRHWLADQVRDASANGIRVYGWLPGSRGAKELAEYASLQGASLVVVPSDLEHKDLGGWLKGNPSVKDVDKAVDAKVIIVDVQSGEVREPESSGAATR